MDKVTHYLSLAMDWFVGVLPDLILAIATLVIGLALIRMILKVLKNRMEKRGMDESIRPFLLTLINVGLKVMLFITILSMVGLETTSFVAALGAMAFAIGMALQGSLGNFASGVLILVFKPYKVGDVIDVVGKSGKVKEIQIFNTILDTLENKRIIIPNAIITSNPITNVTGQDVLRIDITFGISYTDDISAAREVILEVISRHPKIMKDIAPEVPVGALGASSVNLISRCWVNSDDYWEIRFFLIEEVKKAFDDKGISIPFPQMDVHMKPDIAD